MSAEGGIWKAAFEGLEARRGEEPAWLVERRQAAWAHFEALGLPTQRLENWKYTGTKAITNTEWGIHLGGEGAQIGAEAIAQVRFGGLDSACMVFVDGAYRADLSDLDGIEGAQVGPISAALAEGGDGLEPYLGRIADGESRAFVALNTALFTDGALIHVPRNTALEKPIHLIFVATETGQSDSPVASTLRNLIVVELSLIHI